MLSTTQDFSILCCWRKVITILRNELLFSKLRNQTFLTRFLNHALSYLPDKRFRCVVLVSSIRAKNFLLWRKSTFLAFSCSQFQFSSLFRSSKVFSVHLSHFTFRRQTKKINQRFKHEQHVLATYISEHFVPKETNPNLSLSRVFVASLSSSSLIKVYCCSPLFSTTVLSPKVLERCLEF